MLKPSKEFIATVAVIIVVFISVQFMTGPRNPLSNRAQVVSGDVDAFGCTYDPDVIVQNGGFEMETNQNNGVIPDYIYETNHEMCSWYATVSTVIRDSIGVGSSKGARLTYTRHSYSGNPDSIGFNSHKTSGIVQRLENIYPGDYTFSVQLKPNQPIGFLVGMTDTPLVDIDYPWGCNQPLTNTALSFTTNHHYFYNESNCFYDLFDKIIYLSETNEFNVLNTFTEFSHPFTISEGENLEYLYIFPIGMDPEFYVPVGSLIKPSAVLILDNVSIDPVIADGSCMASTITRTDTDTLVLKKSSGNLVAMSAGSSLALDELDSPLITPSAFSSQYPYSSPAVLVQRIGENRIAITPADPETVYTLEDIQSMFDFNNAVITDFDAVLELNSDDLFGMRSTEKKFSLGPERAHAIVQLTTYVVSFDCRNGGAGEYVGPTLKKPSIDLIKVPGKTPAAKK